FSSRRRHTRSYGDWSSDVCSSDLLNQTFITPFDREDIHKLASSIDDVLDYLNSAGDRLVLYKIQSVPSDAEKLAELVTLQCEERSEERRVGKEWRWRCAPEHDTRN